MAKVYKKIINKTKNTILAEKAEIADTPLSRSKGLLGRNGLEEGEGLIIIPCSSIHTFFMRFSIDAAFLDKNNIIVAMKSSLQPSRIFGSIFKGKLVIELSEGTLQRTKTEPHDVIEFA